MNFNQWFDKFSIGTAGGYSNSDYQYVAEESWNACKKEILDILNNNKELDENRMSYYNGNIRQEIENL